MTDLVKLKTRINVIEVLEVAGASFSGTDPYADEVKFFCPFCEDLGSTKPAGSVNTLENVWHCWNCNRGGTVIDAAMEITKGSFNDALTWLLVHYPEEEVLLDPWAEGQ